MHNLQKNMSNATLPPVLDACCGSRMFWFDRKDDRATFVDKRRERHTLPDISSKGGSRELVIDPDHLADFTDLPFPSDTFALVVFDPPHFERNGATGWVGLKYGTLKGDWQSMLREGFAECFRVLRPEGVLIFKWCEDEIPVSRILALTPERPLFGHRSGKQQKTHWVTFMKPYNAGMTRTGEPMSDEKTMNETNENKPAGVDPLVMTIADIRESLGVGHKPMLSELPGICNEFRLLLSEARSFCLRMDCDGDPLNDDLARRIQIALRITRG